MNGYQSRIVRTGPIGGGVLPLAILRKIFRQARISDSVSGRSLWGRVRRRLNLTLLIRHWIELAIAPVQNAPYGSAEHYRKITLEQLVDSLWVPWRPDWAEDYDDDEHYHLVPGGP